MNNPIDIERLLERAGRAESLSEAERSRMRSYLREYAAHLPVRTGRIQAPQRAFLSAFLSWLVRPARFSAALALVLAVFSGGVVYAAEGTLPGDTLYPVKISVNEPVRIALATSPDEKATLYMSYAERRIDEAASLAAKGALATTTEIALAQNFEENAANAAAEVTRENAQAPETASVSATSFAKRLSAYEQVLIAARAQRGGAATSTDQLRAAIRTQIALLATEEDETDVAAPVHTTALTVATAIRKTAADTSTSTDKLRHAADTALKNTADVVETARDALGTTTSANARARLERAAALAARGQALLLNNDDEGASEAFRASISATAELDVLTHAAVKLGINAFGTSESDSATSTQAATGTPSYSATTTGELPRVEDTDSR